MSNAKFDWMCFVEIVFSVVFLLLQSGSAADVE